MITTKKMCERVANQTNVEPGLAYKVIQVFLHSVRWSLKEGDSVGLKGVCALFWGEEKERPGVYTLKARPYQGLEGERRMAEEGMEKYGVQLDDDKVKTAGEQQEGTCPECGSNLDGGGACPTHGTEPFEKRPGGKDG